MKTSGTYTSYAESFLWVALLTAVTVGVTIIVHSVFVDFVHGNPHRTQANAMVGMLLFPPIFGFVAVIGTFLVFALPQCFQAIWTDILVRRSGRRGLFGVSLALPITAVLAWYSYDYITPTDVNLGINAGPDWTPYRHRLTLQRYVMMLALQTPITLFNILYLDATSCDRSKTPIIIGALLFSVVLGVLYGHWTAEGQYKFL